MTGDIKITQFKKWIDITQKNLRLTHIICNLTNLEMILYQRTTPIIQSVEVNFKLYSLAFQPRFL